VNIGNIRVVLFPGEGRGPGRCAAAFSKACGEEKRFALLDPGLRRGAEPVKPINPWPMIIMLILVCLMIYWVLYR